MFISTMNKGFQITFSNDYTISCQFGAMNYCEHYGRHLEPDYEYGEELRKDCHSSADCEVTIWKKGVKEPVTSEVVATLGMEADECGNLYCVTPDDVAKIIAHLVTL